MADDDIHEPGFIAALFDEMAASYGITNYISSLGFCERWRRQTIDGVVLVPGLVVVELMSGMGECWRFIQRGLEGRGRVISVDLSSEMCRRALRNRSRFTGLSIDVMRGNALSAPLPNEAADRIVACFGLKTFSQGQLVLLAREVRRLLKQDGTFSFVEIATPRRWLLRVLYLFYLRHLIPVIGRLFLGNPDNYRLLAVYTHSFGHGDCVRHAFTSEGLVVQREDLFFGCAQRFTGHKGTFAAKLVPR